jgi:hypothetical protein
MYFQDPVLQNPLMIGDAQDWVANAFYFLGDPVVYSARPPLFPLFLAGLASLSMLGLAPVVIQLFVLLTGLAFYKMLSATCNRLVTALAVLAWLTNATWIWWAATWTADVPAACLLGWALIFWQRRDRHGRPGYPLAGLAAGLSAVTQPVAVLVGIPAALAVFRHHRADLRSKALATGAALFLAPGIIWAGMRLALVGTLGDLIYRRWGAVGAPIDVVPGNSWFYAWSLVAFLGIPAMVPLVIGLWSMVREVGRSDWAVLTVGGATVILGFFVFVYGSSTARFLAYIYPFALVFLVRGLSRFRYVPVAVALALLMLVWNLPLREEMRKWHRIVIAPHPPLDLRLSVRQIEGVWTLVPGFVRTLPVSAPERLVYAELERLQRQTTPLELSGERLESDLRAVYLSETSDGRHRLYHQTRLGNQLRMQAYHLSYDLVAEFWPLAEAERLGLQDSKVLYRMRLPDARGSVLVALKPGGRAARNLRLFAHRAAVEQPQLETARRIASVVHGGRILVLCGPKGAEHWQAYLPFVVDALDLWYVGAWGVDMIGARLGEEEQRRDIGGIVLSRRRLGGSLWWVLDNTAAHGPQPHGTGRGRDVP